MFFLSTLYVSFDARVIPHKVKKHGVSPKGPPSLPGAPTLMH